MGTGDEKYMQAALKLAQRGIGAVEPNPAVGCIIVKAGQVIGKGWHKKFAGPHAEINAIEDCKTLGASPAGAVMYVTLEPCCHQGKTGPCTDAIIKAKPAKVFVAMLDPSQHAGGKGVEQLRSAGIEVQTGLCQGQARLLNAPFIKFATTGRSWVVLKWAQSIDGKLAWAKSSDDRWISSEQSRKDAHKLRKRTQAILVGIETVLADDPLLTPRPAKDKKPLRIVMDSQLRIPLDCKLLKTVKKSPVLIIISQKTLEIKAELVEKITQKQAEVLAYPDMQGRSNLYFLMEQLKKRGVAQMLVEGGARVIASFLKEGIADEICVYIAPKILAGQGKVSVVEAIEQISQAPKLRNIDIQCIGGDVRITGLLENRA